MRSQVQILSPRPRNPKRIIISKTCTIYIVRHGQSVFNRDALISGHVDPPLTDKGRQQARAAKDKLANVHFDEAYSSDLQRAVETASIIFGKPIPKSHQLEGFRERDFGHIDGKPGTHLDGLHEKLMAMSLDERWLYSHAPGMESDRAVADRFMSTLSEVAASNSGKTILIATHSGCIRTLLIELGYVTHGSMPPGSFENAGYVELIYDKQGFKVKQVTGAAIQTG